MTRRVFTIPPDRCFVTTLAQGLWRRVEGDPLALSGMLVYLPTRRACRALREAFLRVTETRAALLPRLQPLGDVDEVELDFAGAQMLGNLPPAISPLRRQMLLAKLIAKKDPSLPLDQTASLAASLAALLDQAQTEGRDFADLAKLVPENYAQHWQETLKFLEIVTAHWPAVLKAEGCMDPAERRNKVLAAQGAQWRASPPQGPVIAAGSTGSVPAVGAFMHEVAALPQGEVILPGLDLTLDEEGWQVLDETHPQFTMKHWLESGKLDRAEVLPWDGCAEPVRPARVRLLQETMRPAAVTDLWRHLSDEEIPPEATAGLERLDMDHHREEADVIALRLRAALEQDGQTAALITPDRALAARVAAALGRWGIAANDSAGSPLSAWPVGSFLSDLLAAAEPGASPVAYLTVLKHPLAACGLDPAACRHRARAVEVTVWRGVRLSQGWTGAAESLAKRNPPLSLWLRELAEAFAPLVEGWNKPRPLAEHLAAHVALAERLASTAAEAGAARLWRGEAGEAAVLWLDDWRAAGVDFPELTGRDYARLFAALIGAVMVRPSYGQHPRLSILGPLEARLLHHDLIILGGLNEGTWPPAPPVDPWLSRPMKKEFGLPSPERRVGLSAHDFLQMACASRVLITRARRVGGSPTVPSRFLLQLETVLKAVWPETDVREILKPAEPWRAWAKALDEPETQLFISPPRPYPPVDVRPRRLSVTEIGTWLRNPYAIYAKHILRLTKMEDIDAEVDAAEHGSAIHAALENFLRATMTAWPAEPLQLLLEEGRKAFAAWADRPQVMAFWWPRFERIAAWFVEEETNRRAEGIQPLAVESKGEISILGGAFTLSGRADRMDRLDDGRTAIIDYKTGQVPSVKMVLTGYEPQLPLLALMAAAGAFRELGPREAGELSYWKLSGGTSGEKIMSFTENLPEQIEKAKEGLENLIETFARPTTPYEAIPKPQYAPRYDDYAHLARLAEWGRINGGES